MDPFTQDLKSRLDKVTGQTPPWEDVNPLVVIGLTETVLDLGLTEEQIYAVIRSYGRQLAAQVHPDRKPKNVSPQRQKQIMGAFDLLDNQENFIRALNHFKTIRAEDRREVRILNQAINALKHQLSEYSSQYKQFALDREAFDNERQEYERLKREEPLAVPILKTETEQVEKKLRSEIENWKERFIRLKKERDDLEDKVRSIREPLQNKYRVWRDNKESKMMELKTQNSSLQRNSRFLSRENAMLKAKVEELRKALDISKRRNLELKGNV